jgi:hypothetical protein
MMRHRAELHAAQSGSGSGGNQADSHYDRCERKSRSGLG